VVVLLLALTVRRCSTESWRGVARARQQGPFSCGERRDRPGSSLPRLEVEIGRGSGSLDSWESLGHQGGSSCRQAHVEKLTKVNGKPAIEPIRATPTAIPPRHQGDDQLPEEFAPHRMACPTVLPSPHHAPAGTTRRKPLPRVHVQRQYRDCEHAVLFCQRLSFLVDKEMPPGRAGVVRGRFVDALVIRSSQTESARHLVRVRDSSGPSAVRPPLALPTTSLPATDGACLRAQFSTNRSGRTSPETATRVPDVACPSRTKAENVRSPRAPRPHRGRPPDPWGHQRVGYCSTHPTRSFGGTSI